ncbi:hypothetical protein, partial [Fulvivirga aurantia]|uniref:hypothetical protein n=1 Tax=Fulvivirga aurantia TaxID=2529383 RepID=UPI0012BC6805
MVKPLIHIIFLSLLIPVSVVAQNKKANLEYLPSGQNLNDQLTSAISYTDTLQVVEEVSKNINALHKAGFLLSRVNGVTQLSDSSFTIEIFTGPRFEWVSLSSGNLNEEIQSRVSFKERSYTQKPFRLDQVGKLYDRILSYGENNGYPFASISLDSVKVRENTISASLQFQPGPLITFDSLIIKGDSFVKKSWLEAYLDIRPGEPFSQTSIDNIDRRLKRLSFARLTEVPVIVFKNEKAEITLTLEKVKTNRIDGIIGFLPNEKADGSTLITGQFEMALNNLFNSGKALDVHWQSLKPESQLLELSYFHRNLFYSPLDFESSFYLLKEDSTFINRKGLISFHYQPSLHDISFFTRLESSRSLSTQSEQRADVSDFNINYYGLRHEYTDITDTKVPRGIATHLELAVGSKKIRNIDNLPPEIINQVDSRSAQYNIQGSINPLLRLSNSFGTSIRLTGAKIFNDNLFLNDLYRVGGLQSLRGFNENFFFAEQFLTANLEVRLHYDETSYLFVFYDQAYLSY